MKKTFYEDNYSTKIIPMTLEASVVRLSDVIAYIGRDIEDAIKIGIVKREDIPIEVTNVLGNNNSKIVDTLIKDIIINSMDKPYLAFSDEVFDALMKLKDWNYEYIYASKEANKNQEQVETWFYKLYDCYLEKARTFTKENNSNNIVSVSDKNLYAFIKNSTDEKELKRAIIDYMAGQTDQFFLSECAHYIEGINIEELYK